MLRPMLAAKKAQDKDYRFPCIVQPKYDGIRALVDPATGNLYSRNLKWTPNQFIQNYVKRYETFMNNVDGELVVGPSNAPDCYRASDSGVMSAHGEPDFTYYVFDIATELPMTYMRRRWVLEEIVLSLNDPRIRLAPDVMVYNLDELAAAEAEILQITPEGCIVRDPDGTYKQGRSTLREGKLIARKGFEDAEGVVVGFQEEMANNNEATTNALGYTERSSHKANKTPKGRMGALLVRAADGVEHKIGTGFTALDRQHIWDNRETYLGKTVKYKKQIVGGYDKPRIPVFLGWRGDL